jgi:hypothetical protein
MADAADTHRMTLHGVFQTMHRLLRGEITPADASTMLGCEESRIALYPEFVLDHVRNILVKDFPVLASLFSTEEWEAIVRQYFQTHPPDHYEMNANAARFPAFLQQMEEEGRLGIGEFHVELAEVEWQEWVIFSSPEKMPVSAEIRDRVLNPTLTVLELNFPVVEYLNIWEERRAKGFSEGVPPVPETSDGEIVFVFRHPSKHETVVQKATDSLLFVFKVVHDNVPLNEAAEEAQIGPPEAESMLMSAEEMGLIILPGLDAFRGNRSHDTWL